VIKDWLIAFLDFGVNVWKLKIIVSKKLDSQNEVYVWKKSCGKAQVIVEVDDFRLCLFYAGLQAQ